MKAFLAGTLALIVLGTLVQDAPARRVQGIAGVLTQAGKRMLSAQVAGVPDRSARRAGPPAAAPSNKGAAAALPGGVQTILA